MLGRGGLIVGQGGKNSRGSGEIVWGCEEESEGVEGRSGDNEEIVRVRDRNSVGTVRVK